MGETWNKGTVCVQEDCTKNGEPRVLPLHQTTTYKYDTLEDVTAFFDLRAEVSIAGVEQALAGGKQYANHC